MGIKALCKKNHIEELLERYSHKEPENDIYFTLCPIFMWNGRKAQYRREHAGQKLFFPFLRVEDGD
jgi:hypothetical protein